MQPTIGIIGAGHMGGTLYTALSKVFPKESLIVCDRHTSKLKRLGVHRRSSHPNELIETADIIILAVKPQSLSTLLEQVSGACEKKVIISLMAGVSCKTLLRFGSKKIVRVMPNLPAIVGQALTGCYFSRGCSSGEKKVVLRILETLGVVIEVKKEDHLNKITALSGSGPAYVFFLCEALEEQARKMGFSTAIARRIATQTLVGSARLLAEGHQTAAAWRAAVTSPGGTTAAAVAHLETAHVKENFGEAVMCAYRRAQDLSRLI